MKFSEIFFGIGLWRVFVGLSLLFSLHVAQPSISENKFLRGRLFSNETLGIAEQFCRAILVSLGPVF